MRSKDARIVDGTSAKVQTFCHGFQLKEVFLRACLQRYLGLPVRVMSDDACHNIASTSPCALPVLQELTYAMLSVRGIIHRHELTEGFVFNSAL